jgi:hypothetical protein
MHRLGRSSSQPGSLPPGSPHRDPQHVPFFPTKDQCDRIVNALPTDDAWDAVYSDKDTAYVLDNELSEDLVEDPGPAFLISPPADNLHPSVGERLPDACGTVTERDEAFLSLSRLSSAADFDPSSAPTDDPGDTEITSLPFFVDMIDMTTVEIDLVLDEQMAAYGFVPSHRSYRRSDEDDDYRIDLTAAAALQDLEGVENTGNAIKEALTMELG